MYKYFKYVRLIYMMAYLKLLYTHMIDDIKNYFGSLQFLNLIFS